MKVKEELNKEQDKKNELDWSFAKWLDYFSKEPTEDELDDMQKQSYKIYPSNNTNYQPLRGA
ncbi:MAG: hypothetical protein C0627_11060 [Sulfurimonas sp.]|nr:MAG: hypothetical protein C0627_11060 [Sulfurimonas sp.]